MTVCGELCGIRGGRAPGFCTATATATAQHCNSPRPLALVCCAPKPSATTAACHHCTCTAAALCRGTASLQNVMTDMKAWRVAVQPRRRRHGRVVTAHAGFLKACAWPQLNPATAAWRSTAQLYACSRCTVLQGCSAAQHVRPPRAANTTTARCVALAGPLAAAGLHRDFDGKILSRVAQIAAAAQAAGAPLRIWVTGGQPFAAGRD